MNWLSYSYMGALYMSVAAAHIDSSSTPRVCMYTRDLQGTVIASLLICTPLPATKGMLCGTGLLQVTSPFSASDHYTQVEHVEVLP